MDFESDAPDATLLNRETLAELAGALEKLSQDQRDIIILLYYEKLDRKAVAEMFNPGWRAFAYIINYNRRKLKCQNF